MARTLAEQGFEPGDLSSESSESSGGQGEQADGETEHSSSPETGVVAGAQEDVEGRAPQEDADGEGTSETVPGDVDQHSDKKDARGGAGDDPEPETQEIPIQGSAEPERDTVSDTGDTSSAEEGASADEVRTEALPETGVAAAPAGPVPATEPLRTGDDDTPARGADPSAGTESGSGDEDADNESSGHDGAGVEEDGEPDGPARTEAMPAPAPGAVSFAGVPPEDDSGDGEDASRTSEQRSEDGAEKETAALWPEPRRLSDYVTDRPEPEDSSEGAAAAPAAGATSAAASGGAAPPSGPGNVSGVSGGPRQGDPAEHGAGAPGGPQGPGGPKGPPSGPGGPKGPGGGSGKKKQKRRKPLWFRLLRAFLLVTGLIVILGCGAFAYFYTTVEVPDAAKADAVEQGSTFYFADGETEFAYRGTDRDVISYDEMVAGGDHIVDAVISAEDRGFWTEPGVSVKGTTRAVWSTITGEQVQGGSTVTQQMVRNYYEGVSREQTVSRKIQEIIISIKVDQSEDKEWVMEQYLNTIYFGRMSYGVQAAAQAYYHKDVDELTAEEAAFLAAAIQQPTPFGQADVETTPEMESRWQYVIDGMVTTGAITQAEADEMEFPAPEPEKITGDVSGYRGYMLQEAMSELDRLGYTEDMVNRQGYRIVTTFDKDMMDAAYEAVDGMVSEEEMPEGINIGLSTVDPETGEVLAFFGGHDYNDNQYDSSFLGSAQAGSAFKPYVLATALKQGIGLNTRVDGRGPQNINGQPIQNAGNAPGGIMTLTEATQVSNNLGYIELAQRVGYEEIRETAYDAGLKQGSIKDNQLVPVMPLGANSVRPVDQASGYATFANGGVHVEAHVIREIVNQAGEDERPEVESDQAFSESVAADLTYALKSVADSGTGRTANLWDPNHPTAGKTGTVRDEQNGGTSAAWFVGYTPQLSTSVGVYSDNNRSFTIPGQNISSTGLPSQVWNRYMQEAVKGLEPASFPGPEFGGNTEDWAPDVSTQEPQEPQAPVDTTEPQEPVDPVETDVPREPVETEEPGVPVTPGEPGGPGDSEEPGIPEPPPSRGEEEEQQ
ncbi:membrane peptidoglycan carboxypeptidase [Nocardiopsis terrae]|uniref:Membrane peptidoglycan carboxypeptidase n=1 Tax=Nocardiopsis terrae TaxID=372655 RepID=A0ABR9HL60_9ACTN|nr:membrane peptidoglycan carboxypeptidase [Nocardiopsis terrae]